MSLILLDNFVLALLMSAYLVNVALFTAALRYLLSKVHEMNDTRRTYNMSIYIFCLKSTMVYFTFAAFSFALMSASMSVFNFVKANSSLLPFCLTDTLVAALFSP